MTTKHIPLHAIQSTTIKIFKQFCVFYAVFNTAIRFLYLSLSFFLKFYFPRHYLVCSLRTGNVPHTQSVKYIYVVTEGGTTPLHQQAVEYGC